MMNTIINTKELENKSTLAHVVEELINNGCDRKLILNIGLEMVHDMNLKYWQYMFGLPLDSTIECPLTKYEMEAIENNYDAFELGYNLYNAIHCDIPPVTDNDLFTPEELRKFDAMLEAEEESYPFDNEWWEPLLKLCEEV